MKHQGTPWGYLAAMAVTPVFLTVDWPYLVKVSFIGLAISVAFGSGIIVGSVSVARPSHARSDGTQAGRNE